MINWWSILLFSVMLLAALIHVQRYVKLIISHINIYTSIKKWRKFRTVRL